MKNKEPKKKPSVHDLVRLINQKKKEKAKTKDKKTEKIKSSNNNNITSLNIVSPFIHTEKGTIKREDTIHRKNSSSEGSEGSEGRVDISSEYPEYSSVYKNHKKGSNDTPVECKIQRKEARGSKEAAAVGVQNERMDKYGNTKTKNSDETENGQYENESSDNARQNCITERKLESTTEEETTNTNSKKNSKKKKSCRKKRYEENDEIAGSSDNERDELSLGSHVDSPQSNNAHGVNGVKLFMIDYKECQNKKCSCKKLYRFKKIRKVETNRKFKGIVLTPFCNKYFSIDDKKIIDIYGLSVIDCSWRSIDTLKKVKFSNQRKLPYCIAANSINYGKAYKLSCLESLAFCLYICNYREQCDDILKLYKWSPSFISINKELLDAYKLCNTHDAVEKTETYFLQKYLKEKEDNKKVDQYMIVYEDNYITSDHSSEINHPL